MKGILVETNQCRDVHATQNSERCLRDVLELVTEGISLVEEWIHTPVICKLSSGSLPNHSCHCNPPVRMATASDIASRIDNCEGRLEKLQNSLPSKLLLAKLEGVRNVIGESRSSCTNPTSRNLTTRNLCKWCFSRSAVSVLQTRSTVLRHWSTGTMSRPTLSRSRRSIPWGRRYLHNLDGISQNCTVHFSALRASTSFSLQLSSSVLTEVDTPSRMLRMIFTCILTIHFTEEAEKCFLSSRSIQDSLIELRESCVLSS